MDVVGDGVAAVAAVTRASYDVVLMDVQMPRMDGITATAEIRKLAGRAGMIPIIAMTANVLPEQVERCRRALGAPGTGRALVLSLRPGRELVCDRAQHGFEELFPAIGTVEAHRDEVGSDQYVLDVVEAGDAARELW